MVETNMETTTEPVVPLLGTVYFSIETSAE